MPDNLYCDQTTPWQGVYFFINTVYREIDTLYMCHSNVIVLLPHISPWNQSWMQAFIVAYQNLTFKSVKQNCCFRNQRWDAVQSRQALKKGCIKSTNQNAIFFARIYQTPIWIGTKINLFFFWLVYLQTSIRRHATQMNWINTKVKCIVHMGLSKVKILRKPVVS